MKQKDMIYLLLAVIILLVAGYVVYTNLLPKNTANNGVIVEKVGVIPSQMDAEGLAQLTDPTIAKSYGSPIEFSGLNNAAPFGK